MESPARDFDLTSTRPQRARTGSGARWTEKKAPDTLSDQTEVIAGKILANFLSICNLLKNQRLMRDCPADVACWRWMVESISSRNSERKLAVVLLTLPAKL
jgi:hypothetical protein